MIFSAAHSARIQEQNRKYVYLCKVSQSSSTFWMAVLIEEGFKKSKYYKNCTNNKDTLALGKVKLMFPCRVCGGAAGVPGLDGITEVHPRRRETGRRTEREREQVLLPCTCPAPGHSQKSTRTFLLYRDGSATGIEREGTAALEVRPAATCHSPCPRQASPHPPRVSAPLGPSLRPPPFLPVPPGAGIQIYMFPSTWTLTSGQRRGDGYQNQHCGERRSCWFNQR